MKYYKYLNLDWVPSANKIKEYIYKNPHLLWNTGSSWRDIYNDPALWIGKENNKPQSLITHQELLNHVPELLDMIAPLNINIRFIGLYVNHKKEGLIHIDEDTYSKCRINIPVLNCENTETKFYTTDIEPITIHQSNGVSLKKINQQNCIYVDSYYLTQAVIFRNTEPHQVVVNHDNMPRISCSIGFFEDIEYLLF